MLKNLVDLTSVPLFIIMKKLLSEGTLPDKTGKQLMSHQSTKKGLRDLAENYSPVSLTSVLCRLMKKFIKDQIFKHLERENLLSTKQHDFVKKRYTLIVLNLWQVVVWLMLYTSTSPRHLIPSRIAHCWKNWNAWYQQLCTSMGWSFPSDRSQLVKVNGDSSMKCCVRSGVPQWSVLEPLLFVMFINDLPEVVKSILYLFADDTNLLGEVKSLQDALRLQGDFDQMENLSQEWLIKFHSKKCHVFPLWGRQTSNTYTHTNSAISS